jgi:hypothetical protein
MRRLSLILWLAACRFVPHELGLNDMVEFE